MHSCRPLLLLTSCTIYVPSTDFFLDFSHYSKISPSYVNPYFIFVQISLRPARESIVAQASVPPGRAGTPPSLSNQTKTTSVSFHIDS